MIIPFYAQIDPQAGQIERILNRLLDGGEGAYVIILLIILGFVLYTVSKVLSPLIKTAQEATITFTNASRDQVSIAEKQVTVTQQVNANLEANTAVTTATKEIVGEIKGMVENNSTAAQTTASDIDAIKKTLETLGQNVSKLATDSGVNTTDLSQVRQKLTELTAALTTAIARMDTPAPTATVTNVIATPLPPTAAQDSIESKE